MVNAHCSLVPDTIDLFIVLPFFLSNDNARRLWRCGGDARWAPSNYYTPIVRTITFHAPLSNSFK